jgi:hypothetical protein
MGANLFAQYLQPARSVMDYMGDMDDQDLRRAQLEGAQRQNALQALVAQQQQKEMAYTDQGRNAIRSAYSANAGAAPDALAGALEQTGHPLAIERADALRKSILDRSKTTAEVGEKTAKTAKETFDLMTSRLNFIGNTIGSVTDARKYAVWKQALTAGGFDVSQFPAEYDPEAVATIGQMTLTMKDRLEQGWKAKEFGLKTNQFGETVRHNKATEGIQVRGQNLVDGRVREGAIAEGGGPSQVAFVKQFGKPSPGYRWKADGSQEAIPGGPADAKAIAATTGRQQVTQAVSELRTLYDDLAKGSGIVDSEKGAMSNISARLSSTGAGQMAGQLVGSKNQKARDRIEQARPLLVQAIAKATGLSAKQMDSNAELKLYLATATDPTKDVAANKAALDYIERNFGLGDGQAQQAPPSGGGAVLRFDAKGNPVK